MFGRRPFENEAVLADISFVRDNQRYPDSYRLKHVLRIAPAFLPNWSEEVAAELVAGLRIPTDIDIRKFSRGQLSSVAIVLGLASRAPVTLLDEPYLGLDVTARSLFHDVLLREFAAHPRTVLLSTHLIEESEALLDRVVIVDRGRIWFEGDIEEAARVAFTLSGPADAVGRLAEGRTLLRSHTVGGLAALTVEGIADDELRTEARRVGAQLTGTSLHDLVAAVGESEPELVGTHERNRPMSVVVSTVRLHLNQRITSFLVPLYIAGTVAVISILISLIFWRAGSLPGSEGWILGSQANPGIIYGLAGFLIYLGVSSVSTTFPFALTLGATRRAFVAGTLLWNATMAALPRGRLRRPAGPRARHRSLVRRVLHLRHPRARGRRLRPAVRDGHPRGAHRAHDRRRLRGVVGEVRREGPAVHRHGGGARDRDRAHHRHSSGGRDPGGLRTLVARGAWRAS